MEFTRDVENLIANLRRLPEKPSRMRDRKTKPLSSLVEVCFERYAIDRKTPQQTILENWKQLVGESNAHRCSPERINARRQLVIQVANPTLRRELQFIEDRIMTRLRSMEGCDHITGIVLRAG